MTTPSGSPGTDERTTAWTDRRRVFRERHAAGCFVIPNPWDVGSARLLAGLGFPLYAPGIRTKDEIAAVVGAVAPKPVNVLAGSYFATVAELAQLGVRRISVGGALARAAWTGFLEAAREVAQRGTITGLGRAVSFSEINGSFGSG
jgi:2-methylisocitrate lyase-like PEP mutase family enzyme